MLAPIVSVIIPTKNSSSTLGDSLESIKKQTYKNIEIIVVDNHSTDSTPDVAKRYTENFYTQGPERSPQRNFGVKQAKGEFVVIIDSDMNLSPGVIEQCVSCMLKSPNTVGVIIPEESFGEGFWAQCKKLERSFYLGVPYMEAARFFKKDTYEALGGYDESMVSGEDWDLSQRVEKLGELGRVQDFIYHNEGKISLWRTVRKKYYYAQKFASYREKYHSSEKEQSQTSVLGRYKLFFSHPKMLFQNPILGLGMLFMKTCEFGFGGAGFLAAKVRRHRP